MLGKEARRGMLSGSAQEDLLNQNTKPPPETDLAAENECIRRIVAGERELFRELVGRYKNLVYALIARQVGDRSTAEDLAQEVFVKAYSNLGRFRFESKFSSWLVRIALNHTHSYFTSRQYRQMKKNEDLDLHAPTLQGESPEALHEKREFLGHFRRALAALPEIFRAVLVLCGIEGKAYEEAAEILGIPVGTVRSRLNKARLLMRQELGEALRGFGHET